MATWDLYPSGRMKIAGGILPGPGIINPDRSLRV